MPRLLSPFTNPNGYLSAAGAVLAAAVMITNAVHHHGIIDPTVIVAAVAAAGALFARQQVTPVKDPKDGNGSPLVPAPAGATVTAAPAAPEAPKA
jgi:hypothetical protein